jgi:GWxTD domain-containing protein
MRHSPLPVALVAWAVAAFAGAQLSQELKGWPDSPAGFLLTKAERKAYGDITNDAEAKAFIELFWAKRDPDLDTPVNEFKADFQARVDAADRYFSYGSTKGSMSDRGRVLILLGKYAQRRVYKPGELAAESGEEGPRGEAMGGNEVWRYTKAQMPKGVKGDEFLCVFSETHPGAGDFLLERTDRRNITALKVLAAMPDELVLHPKLTEVPRLGLLESSKSASPQQLAVLAVQPRPWPDGSAVVGVPGVLSETIHPFWLLVQLPESAPIAKEAVGRAVSADTGKEAGSFVVATKPVSTSGGNAYEFSIPLDAGKWRIDLALLGDAGPVAVTSYDATVEAPSQEGTYISQLYWGVDIRQEVQARLGDPYNIGGWHALPRVDDTYLPSEQLSYFCFVIRPGVAEPPAPPTPAAGAPPPPTPEPAKPKLELSMQLFSGDKKLVETPPTAVNVSLIRDDLWMFGNGLPLGGFKKAGEYHLVMTLRDTVSNVSRTTTIPVKIAAPPAPAAGK